MSHYLEGKLQLKCSIDVLRRALINIMPTWESHIRVDPQGKIKIYGFGGGKIDNKEFHIMVPGPNNPDIKGAPDNRYGDLGMRMEEDGTWTIMADHAGMTNIKNLQDQLKFEIVRMRGLAYAKKFGCNILRDVDNEDEKYTDLEVDADVARNLLQAH